MSLSDDVRAHCAALAASARSVAIDRDALAAYDAQPAAHLDPELHELDGDPEAVARGLLTLDAINFGSGWFPTLRKDPGRSGYATIARAVKEHGPWSNEELRAMTAAALAGVLRQPADHELIALYAQALRALGRWLGERTALEATAAPAARRRSPPRSPRRCRPSPTAASTSAPRSSRRTSRSPASPPTPTSTASRSSPTTSSRTCCAATGSCATTRAWPRTSTRAASCARGPQEAEIRACAVVACEELSARLGVAPRTLDSWLWNRGQGAAYKALPRHRCRCVFY